MTHPATAGPEEPATAELLRSVFRQHAAGVAVITAFGDKPVGFTATSLNSVSLDPPLVSFGIGTSNSCWPVIAQAEYVGVHLLAADQRELGATFARSGADRFAASTAWQPGPNGVPLLDGVLGRLVCRIVARMPAAGHRIVVAEALTGRTSGPGRPLLYHDGGFHHLAPLLR
ncbi:flavin reductase family protein [Streptomyces noursei]|uniref:flavin reductase family protein n=1 Tax=Streptomyces TaxID=1883 RepID=UPI001F24B502|nr:flavin reductase family protein [Streptomyces noursei]MCE4946610.1 flavin reductase family protein [Streptomyces noursei]